MMFGSEILEKAKTFRITNMNFKENMRNFVGQCVKYDIMLNNKYTFDDLRNSSDLWALITSNPSRNRGIFWIPIEGGRASYVTCAGAVTNFNQAWSAELDRSFGVLGRKFFPGRAGNSGSNAAKFTMSEATQTALKNEIKQNLASVSAYLGDIAEGAEETLRQSLLITAIEDGASENSRLAGNPITYAETRALHQQTSTFDTIGRLAAKLLPIMKAVLEALAYACFIFIIPLCMIPQGYKFLLNWIGVLVWLQAWAPMYAILNYVMNIAARASTLSEIGTANGLTIANYLGVSEANAEMKTLAGYLTMSIPFLCIAIVKGVDTFVNLASQMTGTSMQAASSASGEVTSGNLSFGNMSMGNSQMYNASQLQRNFSSSLASGGHIQDTGGVRMTVDAGGAKAISRVTSGGGQISAAANFASMEEYRGAVNHARQNLLGTDTRLSHARSLSGVQSSSLASMHSKQTASEISRSFGVGLDEARQFSENAKVVDSHNKGHSYAAGSSANMGAGLNVGGVGKLLGGKLGLDGTVSASNTTNHGDSQSSASSQDYSQAKREYDNFLKTHASRSGDSATDQLSQSYASTLSEIDSLTSTKTQQEQELKSAQDSYSRAQTLSFAQRDEDLTQSALEIATKEDGWSHKDASRVLMSPQNAEDKEQSNRWYQAANDRVTIRPSAVQIVQRGGNQQFMNADGMGRSFDDKASQSKRDANAFGNEISHRKSITESSRSGVAERISVAQRGGHENVAKGAEMIKKHGVEIGQKVEKRSKEWLASAAWNHIKK